MNRVMTTLLASAGALALASSAAAQEAPYFDLSGGYSRISATSEGVDLDLDSIVVRGTFHLNQHIGAEAEGQFGLSEDTVGGIDFELSRALGLFLRGDVQPMEGLGLFGRIGYVDAELEASAGGLSVSDSDDGWAGGVGAEAFFNPTVRGGPGVRADYTYYDFSEGTEADSISLSLFYRFGG